MFLSQWVRRLQRSAKRHARSAPDRGAGRRAARRFVLESLEERSLLSGLSWSAGVSLPSPRSDASAVASPFDGSLLLIGGNPAASGKSVSQLLYGDDHWTNLADLDAARVAPAVGLDYSGGLLIAGGKSGGSLLRSGVSYDPAAGVTGSLLSLDVGREQFGGVQAGNGDLYVIGGKDSDGQVLDGVEFRSFAEGGWDDGAPKLPVAEFAAAAVSDWGSNLYVLGGATSEGAGGISNRVFVYDTAQEEWRTLAPLPTAVRDAAAIYSPLGKIYVFGGISASGAVATVQVYDVAANQWNYDAALPEAISGEAAVLDGSYMVHLLGGRNASGTPTASVFVSNDITQIDLAPVFNSAPELQAEPNLTYYYQADAAGSPAPTYSLTTAPAGMSIEESTGFLQWTPTPEQLGANAVTIRAANVAGFVDQSFTIDVHWTAPTIRSSPLATADVGKPYAYRAIAAGNPAPTFSVVSGPGGMTIDGLTGQISWTPTVDQLGAQAATIRATNLAGSVEQTFTVNVFDRIAPTAPGNLIATPVTASSALLEWSPATDNVGVAEYRIYSVRRTGWRGSHIVYTLVGSTSDTRFMVDGLSSSTPPKFVVRAVDVAGNSSANSLSVSPRPLIAPNLYYWSGVTTNGALGIVANHKFSLQLVVSGSPAPTLSLDAGPTGMTISPTGVVEWTPTAADVGAVTATIRATNVVGSKTLTTTINVAPDLPVITYAFSGSTVVGQETTIVLRDLSLTPATFAIVSAPAGVTLDAANTLHFTPAPDQAGPSTIVVVATNSAGSTQATISLTALMSPGPTDVQASGLTGNAPRLSWTAPASAVPIAGYKIVASYSVHAGRFRRTYTTTIDSPGVGTDAALVGLKTGVTYTVRVQAYDAAGNVSLWSAPITLRYTPSLPKLMYVINPDRGAYQPLRAVAGEPLMIKLMDSNPLDRVYSIASGPAGMTIDPVSGVVHWTPSLADVGAANVLLRATNEVGSTDVALNIPVYFTGKSTAVVTGLAADGTGVISAASAADNSFNLDQIVGYVVTISHRNSGRSSWYVSRTITIAPGGTAPFVAPVRGAVVYRVSARAIDANGNLGEPAESFQFILPPA